MNLHVALSAVLIFSAVCYGLLALRLFGGKRQAGSTSLGAVFAVIGLWVLGGAIELLATSETVFIVGRVGHFVGTSLVPVSLLICFREFSGSRTSLLSVVALLVVPILSIVVASTNQIHELMWLLPATNAAGEFLTRPEQWGPWFLFVHAPFGYLVVSAGILSLLLHSSAVAPTYRLGMVMLAGAAVPPVIAAVAYDLGLGPNTISILPLVFAGMLPVYAWLLIGKRIIDFSPIAYETVFQNMQDPVIVLDDQERVIGLNRGAEALLNMTEQEAMRASLDAVFGADVPEVRAALGTGLPQRIMTNTGRFLHLQVTAIASDDFGVAKGRVLMFRDVSDVEKAQREVRNNERLLRTLIDHSVNGVIRLRWISPDGGHDNHELRCIFANAAAGRFLRIDPNQMIDKTADEVTKLYSTGMNKKDADDLLNHFLDTARNGEVFDTEVGIMEGRRSRWLRIISEPVGEDVAVTFVDVTDRKAKEAQMESIAQSDALTGVLNRRGFEKEAARKLTNSADDATGALLFIDLNDFKLINDRCGHEIGDQLLTLAAERLKTSLRPDDIIGRPGGDEFVALVPDVSSEIAQTLAERLTRSLEQPYLIAGEKLDCSAAIGLALYPRHANTLTGLLRAADQAMYRAKARCRGGSDIDHSNRLEKAG
jgi:diguanylate cyclase (GGDEF)-like protein